MLQQRGVATRDTKFAGASAGSLISAVSAIGIDPATNEAACRDLATDCRKFGTRGRLRAVLRVRESGSDAALPAPGPPARSLGLPGGPAARGCPRHHPGKAFCGSHPAHPLAAVRPCRLHGLCAPEPHPPVAGCCRAGPKLLSEFDSREDLIEALLTSCHVPWWLDGSAATTFRSQLHFDGGLTDFIPQPEGAGRVFRVTCFPVSDSLRRSGLYENLAIAPDLYRPDCPSMKKMVDWAFNPGSNEEVGEGNPVRSWWRII